MSSILMQDLKSIIERNIDIERQKLYKEKEVKAHRDFEAHDIFIQEASYIEKLFNDQNPLYTDFILGVVYNENSQFEITLCTLREGRAPEAEDTEYFYRGQRVKKQNNSVQKSQEYITELPVVWLVDQNKWAIKHDVAGTRISVINNRSDLIKVFLNLTIKDIAKILEREADQSPSYAY